ncbi:LANO_0E12574g1_1 [Lachancea nothofagi CBS 11611]|uniref:LANO_0E12574g1_1 n=1 Tax=Lachancea nothofagi CBS 11611 TaxID=1266666 RepID=A0A1G4JYB7_9SACH|nr:LANO_0E12574g1_1 [Lachancea nothofagi CBS 11611]
MPDGVKSKSPLIKSLSSKDLRRRGSHRAGFLNADNSGSREDGNDMTSGAEEHLLQDLDNILYKKLHLGESSPNSGSLRGSPISLSPPRSPNDQTDTEVDSNVLDSDAQQEEEDEDFANVDEIDGPISPSSSSGSLKDLTKSHLHKSVDETLNRDVDFNLPVDKELQSQLNKRAQEIENDFYIYQPSKASLQWSMQDFYTLQDELPDWFCFADYRALAEAKNSFEKRFDSSKFLGEAAYANKTTNMLVEELTTDITKTSRFEALTYISMGLFGSHQSKNDHVQSIRDYNLLLTPFMPVLLKAFITHATLCRDENSHLRHYTKLFFYSGTLMFFFINVLIESQEDSSSSSQRATAIAEINKANLLEFIVKYIEHWRWNSRLSMRVRSAILLLHRLLLLQFGDMRHYEKVKTYVHQKHSIKPKGDRSNKLIISPLDYHAFREDISARFPTFIPPASDVPACFDSSNSLSQFLEIPRPKSKSTLNLNIGAPEYHIATPMPSPSSSPTQQTRGGSKSRKSFQTNLAYPSMYPSDDENGAYDPLTEILPSVENMSGDGQVPFSVGEATRILHNSVEVKLSTRQLWHERELFMAQERGWGSKDEKLDSNLSYYYKDDDTAEAQTMARVEDFYEKCLPSFSSIVYVLLQTIESNVNNRAFTSEDLPNEAAELKAGPQLEIIRSKEVALKSASSILFLLNKWFKLSHILKYEHLCVILHDCKFINVATGLLNNCTDRYPERVFGKIVQSKHSFWKACSEFNPAYCEDYKVNHTIIDPNVNLRFLNTEVYLLRVLSQVTGNKTQRLKELPLSIGALLKKLYQVFNLEIYNPILKITQELTPFKNKKWKSEHMDLISGVYLYKKLKLNDNWVTGKDIAGELNDACGQEIALRALLQFYNFLHYKTSVEHLGYFDKSDSSFFSKEAEILTSAH